MRSLLLGIISEDFYAHSNKQHLGENLVEKQGGTSKYSVFYYFPYSGHVGCFNPNSLL
jgi:hypothetical protein